MLMSELEVSKKEVLDPFSRFRGSKTLLYEGVEFFETYERHQFKDRPDDIFHEVGAGEDGRLDLISYLHYRNPRLWWVIAEANGIFNALREVTPGRVLRVPAPAWVFGNIVK
jgi:hypothetical protein